MKAAEIRQLSDEELRSELERLQRHLFDLRAQAVTEKLEHPSMLKKATRDIARELTIRALSMVSSWVCLTLVAELWLAEACWRRLRRFPVRSRASPARTVRDRSPK